MDDSTRWQDATLPADSQMIGPALPTDARAESDELETGIASVFAAIHAAGAGQEANEDADDGEQTYQLLGELDRLWQRPSP